MALGKVVGVLSPILFCIYMDNLLLTLKDNDIGRHVGSKFCGVFAYADDIILLSPSINGLQNMLNCCSKFAIDHSTLLKVKVSLSLRQATIITLLCILMIHSSIMYSQLIT